MARLSVGAIPTILLDDGVMIIFSAVDHLGNPIDAFFGFMHSPISASEPFGNPPVTWSQTSDLGTWVETIKYAYRNNKPIALSYDDEITNPYTSPHGQTFVLNAVYAISDL